MGNLIKSDFYKIIHTKYLYICAVLAAFLSGLVVYAQEMNLSQYGFDGKMLGYTSIDALKQGFSGFVLFALIAVALFVPFDFAHGTIKNIISSGISRWKIYFSKLIVSLTIVLFYFLISVVTSYTVGSILWGVGEYTRDVYIELLKTFGIFLLAEVSVISIYVMIGFLLRKSGLTIAANMIIDAIVGLFAGLVNYCLYTWFKIENFQLINYWPSTYTTKTFQSMSNNEITTCIIVCCAWIVASTLIGLFTFQKRDIK